MRSCVLRLVPTAFALLLGGCLARDPYVATTTFVRSGQWQIEKQMDRVTGVPISSAYLKTPNSSSSAVAFPKPASLHLMCFKDQPVVRIGFEFRVGSNLNSFVGYRFDDKPGHEINGRFIADYKTVMIEDTAELAPFIKELANSRMLYLRTRSLNAPRGSAEFEVEGAAPAITSAYATCPIVEPPQPTPTASRNPRRPNTTASIR